MRRALPAIRAAGGQLVFVGNGSPRFALTFRDDYDLGVEGVALYTDPGRASYEAAGLERSLRGLLDPRNLPAAARALTGGHLQGKTKGDAQQLGGALVIAPSGQILYRHAARYAGDQPDSAALLEALAAASSLPTSS